MSLPACQSVFVADIHLSVAAHTEQLFVRHILHEL